MFEIERKFLLDALPDDIDDLPSTRIRQGYLAITDEVEVRVRARSDDRLLTVKGGSGKVRNETTVALSAEQFDELWELTRNRRIVKRRTVIPKGEVEIEIDVFEGDLDGLLIAEVEFESADASTAFDPPAWFGREITDDATYRNAALASGEVPPGG
jgi:CYTH domain-containing protein